MEANLSRRIDYCLEQYRRERSDQAFHNLLELGESALPLLMQRFWAETDVPLREFILNAIWQQRSAATIEFLGKALLIPERLIWREALDGLVALASEESLWTLREARRRVGGSASDPSLLPWIDEAIGQVEEEVRRAAG